MIEDDLVILTALEQEYLIRAIESALHVRERRQLFLWAQGQFQALLPHEIMVCIQFGENDEIVHIECLHGLRRDTELIDCLANDRTGVAIQLARHCRSGEKLPYVLDCQKPGDNAFLQELVQELAGRNINNAIIHGTERLLGGASFFLLFSLSESPNQRHTFFLELLLPHLHIALLRVLLRASSASHAIQPQLLKTITGRQLEILRWVKEGKSNYEIGIILGISPLTVKNHLQKIYKKLNVQTRVQAVSNTLTLQLLTASSR